MTLATPIHLLVSDVDRTLLTHDYVLPQRVINALDDLRNAGMAIVLASARSPEALRPYASQLGVATLAACFNGGWIGNLQSGATFSFEPIQRVVALDVMTLTQDLGLTALWYGIGGVYALADSPLAAHEVRITGERLQIVSRPADIPGIPGKIMCVRNSPDEHSGFEAMRFTFGDRLSVVGSHWRLLEITPSYVSKRKAIEAIADQLGIAQANCAAAGDAENDVEMLRWAKVALTVGNAIPDIKAFADFIGPTCDEGGVAEAAGWLSSRLPQAVSIN